MTDLAAWLRECIAEDEAAAKEAKTDDGEWWTVDALTDWEGANFDLATAKHIARHDPARVLTECEAKRRIVKYYEALTIDRGNGPEIKAQYWAVRWVVEQMASAYADRPGYNTVWRP